MSDPITEDGAPLSPSFLEFCGKVRKNDHSILPERSKPFKVRHLREKAGMELADALLENTNVTYLELEVRIHSYRNSYMKRYAEAMAKYMRTSKRLQRIIWNREMGADHRVLKQDEEITCNFLSAFQESTSLKELHIKFSLIGGPSNLALENMLTYTQSLQTLTLVCPEGLLAVTAAYSGLKNNTTLQELKLISLRGATTDVSPILTSLCEHPLLRRLSMCGDAMNLTGLEVLLLSGTSKITELDIHRSGEGQLIGLSRLLRALARYPLLTKLGIHCCLLGRNEAKLLQLVLRNIPSLQSLNLACSALGSAGLAELAPALYCNTSIQVLDFSRSGLHHMEYARLLRDILRSNKTITTLDLSANKFGRTTGAIECIADGLGNNSTLQRIDLSCCELGNSGVSLLAQNLGSFNTTLQKLDLNNNSITSAGVGVLLETMEHNNHITDLDLRYNLIGNEGASLLARSLENNALPNLTRLSVSYCAIGDDGFIALMSALEQNTSLLKLDLLFGNLVNERAFLALAESLPDIKGLQIVDISWCAGLASAMPLLLAGLRRNTSLFRFHVTGCGPSSVPPTPEDTAKCVGGWMQEIERLGFRNRFRSLIRAPKERLPPLGVWPLALARVAVLPDVIFEVLRSKPNLVPSEDIENTEAGKDTSVPKKRKRGDE
jgi:Ran GTPase-activating protein (RanGAP) involved in mRNA processing and transport